MRKTSEEPSFFESIPYPVWALILWMYPLIHFVFDVVIFLDEVAYILLAAGLIFYAIKGVSELTHSSDEVMEYEGPKMTVPKKAKNDTPPVQKEKLATPPPLPEQEQPITKDPKVEEEIAAEKLATPPPLPEQEQPITKDPKVEEETTWEELATPPPLPEQEQISVDEPEIREKTAAERENLLIAQHMSSLITPVFDKKEPQPESETVEDSKAPEEIKPGEDKVNTTEKEEEDIPEKTNMTIIHVNPYRIIGIYANATTKDINKQKTKIKAFSKVGKKIESDLDFKILNKANRSEKELNQAFANIEQNKDKIQHALFWLINLNAIDQTALDYLKKGDHKKAEEIWTKVTKSKKVTENNFSALNNLGTLKLLSESTPVIQEGINYKLLLINSEFFNSFILAVADKTYKISKDKQADEFIADLLTQFKKDFKSNEILGLFDTCDDSIKKKIAKKFTEEPIYQIESQIAIAKKGRKEGAETANQYGLSLCENTIEDMAILKEHFSPNDLLFKKLTDNLAKEILQCAIEYFDVKKESMDPSASTIGLMKFALNLAIGEQVIDRIKDNLENVKEWAEMTPVRQEYDSIHEAIEKIRQKKNLTINNVNEFVNNCSRQLKSVLSKIGSKTESYISLSSAVAAVAMSESVDVFNKKQTSQMARLESGDRSALSEYTSLLRDILLSLNSIGNLDMNSDTKKRYKENRAAIKKMQAQVSNATSDSSSSDSSSSFNCYIATMAYGDINHPQVNKLRRFRDEHLIKTQLGRIFTALYYKYSPMLVERLKDKKGINKVIRTLLDSFISKIKKI